MNFSWPFDSTYSVDGNNLPVYDKAVGAEQLASIVNQLVTDGIYMVTSDRLQCFYLSGMQVTINQGVASIQGHQFFSDAPITLTVSSANTSPRIDRVVLRLDPFTARGITPMVIKGTPAASPSAPALVRSDGIYDIGLATIYVGANVTYISQSVITDTRTDANTCGIVKGVLTTVDATTLFAQFTAAFNEWFATAQNTLSGDVAGNLLALINQRVSYTGDDTATDSQRAQARKNTRNYLQTYTNASQIGITLSTTTTLEQLALAMPDGSQLIIVPPSSATSNISPSYARYGVLTLTRASSSRMFATWANSTSANVWACTYTGSTFSGWKQINSNNQSGSVNVSVATGATSGTASVTFSPAFTVAPFVSLTLQSTAPGAYTGIYYSVQGVPTASGFTAVVNSGTAPVSTPASITLLWQATENL